MSSLACKWNWHNTGHQVWYNKSTYETIRTTHPIYFYDDFTGVAGGSVFNGTSIWNVVDVDAAVAAIPTDGSGGIFRLLLAVGGTAQDAVLYHGDNKTFDVTHGLIFETKIDASTLPTGTTQFVAGMSSDHHLVKDTVSQFAWFKMEGSGAIVCETDDNVAIDNNDVATGVTAVAGTANIYRIDFSTLTDVKFFIDGVRVCTSTTFNLNALTAGTVLQPYISIDKPADGSTGVVDIDYVKIWSNRS